ncbi:MAG TPA: hypothetical protein VIV12_06605 [Streptosporangiaceae bacterium]
MARHICITARERDPLDLERLSRLLIAQVRAQRRKQAVGRTEPTPQRGDLAA